VLTVTAQRKHHLLDVMDCSADSHTAAYNTGEISRRTPHERDAALIFNFCEWGRTHYHLPLGAVSSTSGGMSVFLLIHSFPSLPHETCLASARCSCTRPLLPAAVLQNFSLRQLTRSARKRLQPFTLTVRQP
ncbi:unnamed protein product, partial [Phaeothamnion confervicola]